MKRSETKKTKKMTWEEAVLWLRENRPDVARNCYYDDPILDAAQRFMESREWAEISRLTAAHKGTVLELGAGRGIVSHAFAASGWNTYAVELDASKTTGRQAIKKLASAGGVKIQVSDGCGEAIPHNPDTFDLVFARAVLHHARDLHKTCQEIFRVLKPGGLFLAVGDHVIDQQSDLQMFLDSHPLHFLYGGENAFLVEQYQSAMRDAGLEIVRTYNSFECDMNLNPDNTDTMKTRLARRIDQSLSLRLFEPLAGWLPNLALRWYGTRDHSPGRRFSFLCRKP